LPESPFELRFFSGAVKTNSRGDIITRPDDDPVKNLVGAESAGDRAGLERFTKILFGVDYFNGRPDPGTRLDPNSPQVNSGSQHWPFVKQPFRSWPNALALTPDGNKLYVTPPGREGYPDWRMASVDTRTRRVLRWINLSVAGQPRGTRPVGIAVSPLNQTIFPRPYAVVANQYANFASIIDTGTDAVIGQFETGFYGEDLVSMATARACTSLIGLSIKCARSGSVPVPRLRRSPPFRPVKRISIVPIRATSLSVPMAPLCTLPTRSATLSPSSTSRATPTR
jgi:hypothetical protein